MGKANASRSGCSAGWFGHDFIPTTATRAYVNRCTQVETLVPVQRNFLRP